MVGSAADGGGSFVRSRRSRRRFFGVLALVAAAVLMLLPVATPAASAAQLRSRIVGYVDNASGTRLSGINVSVVRYGDETVRTATTDLSGEFTFDVTDTPPDGDGYLVRFTDPADVLGYVEFDSIFLQPGYDEILGVTMTPGGRISGTITNSAGAPVTDACVDVFSFATSIPVVATRCTNASGVYTTPALSSRQWFVSYSSVSGAVESSGDYVDVFAPQTTNRSVQLTSRTGSGVVNGTVVSAVDGVTGVESCIDLYGPSFWSGCTDAAGAYQATGLEPGLYEIYVNPQSSSFLPGGESDIAIAAGANALTTEVGRSGRVVGTVTQPGGGPAVGVTVDACDPSQFGCQFYFSSAVTDAAGKYAIDLPFAGGSSIAVSFGGPGWFPEWHQNVPSAGPGTQPPAGVTLVAITDGVDTVVDAELTPNPTGSIAGVVTDSVSTAPIAAASVLVARVDQPWSVIASASTDALGSYTVAGLEPGSYVARVGAIGYLGEKWDDVKSGDGTPITVNSGATTNGISLALDPQGVIEGVVSGNLPAVTPGATFCVQATPVGAGFDSVTRCRPMGTTYRLPKLPSGVYDLTVTSNDFVTQTIEDVEVVSPNTTVRNITLVRNPVISGVVTDDSTPAVALSGAQVCVTSVTLFFSRCTTSAPDGTYAVALEPGTYTVSSGAPGHVTEYFDEQAQAPGDDVVLAAGADRTDVDFTLTPTSSISGVVTSGGAGLCGIYVTVLDASTGTPVGFAITRCGSSPAGPVGTYDVEVGDGTYKVSFSDFTSRYRTEFWNDAADLAAATEITLDPRENVTGIDAVLAQNPAITGTVVEDGTGTPLAGVQVQLSASGTGAPSPVGSSVTTNAAGQYTLYAPAGSYRIFFDGLRHRDEWYDNAATGATAATVVLTASGLTANASLAPLRAISGTVTGPNGLPASTILVEAFFPSGASAASRYTNPDGTYELFVDEASYVVRFRDGFGFTNVASEYYSNVRRFGAATLVDVIGADATGVDAQLEAAGTISGTIAAPGAGFSTACLEVYDVSLGAGERVDSTCATTGTTYSFRGLLPGTYRVKVSFAPPGFLTEWYSDAASFATATDIVVSANATSTANITLDPAGAAITGQVQDSAGNPLGGVAVSVSNSFNTATTDSFGNFRLAGLADSAGYRVAFSKAGFVSEFYDDARLGDDATFVPVDGADVALGVIQLATATALVSGTVFEANSAAVPATAVCLTFSEVSGTSPVRFGHGYRTCTGPMGTYSLALPPGNFQVYVEGQSSPTKYIGSFAYTATAPYTTVAGPQTLDPTIAVGGQVSGRVVQEGTTTGIPGVTVIVHGPSQTRYFTSAAGGAFITDGLPDGSYSVQFFNFGGRFISQYLGGSLLPPGDLVTISGGNVVVPDVELSLGAVVSGTITDADTSLPVEGCVFAYASGTFNLVASGCSGADGSYSTTGLPNGTFDLRVTAVGYAEQTRSVTISGSTDATANFAMERSRPLGPVQNFTATAGNQQVQLSWSPPLDVGSGIDRYDVLVDEGFGPTFYDSTSSTSYTVTGLTNGQSYSFVIVAVDTDFNSVSSTPASATPFTTTPGPATNVTATPGAGQATISWTAANDGGSPIIDTRVQVFKDGAWVWGATALPPFTSGTVQGLNGGTEYSFRVRSQNANGWGPWSAVVTATPTAQPATPPTVVQNVTATPGTGSVTVSWNTPANIGGSPIIDTRVQVFKDGAWVHGATAVGTATSATVASLTGGTSYQFRVRTQNAAGWSPWSAPVTATPTVATIFAPGAVENVVALTGFNPGEIEVYWSNPFDDGGEAVFDTRVQVLKNGKWVHGATARGGAESAVVSSLTPSATYSFRVRTSNSAGWGPWSAVVTGVAAS
jgi:hypothetical protein